MNKKPTVLMILDGYGLNEKTEGNAVAEGRTPVMDRLMAECPFVRGNASGGRSSRRTDGKFRGGTFEYGCGTYRVPGSYQDHEVH